MTAALKPPIAYYGGKTTMAPWIVDHLPAHGHYVEPFAGSLAVLLAKPPSAMETVNDLDGDLMTWWRILRDHPADLARVCALTPHSRTEHQAAYAPAIARWEHVMGRPAPAPTEPGKNGERLNGRFVEWLMGLPAGWVTDTPGLSRNQALRCLGNGVVPQQGAAAVRMLLERAA